MMSRLGTLCRRALALTCTATAALGAISVASIASAQVVNPGDIVVERQITPRIAYNPVPKSDDPVTSRVSTFPANTFNPTMAQVASDADLTNAHGSTGLDTNAAGGAGLQAVTRILSGTTTNNNVALNSGGIGQPAPGIGGTISQSVTGALAPLSTALGGALGGLSK
jgi:hypothetical protein